MPYLFVTGPYKQKYHTRCRAWLSQAPHSNESIICRRSSSRTNIVTCLGRTVYPTDPEWPPTPSRAASLTNNDTVPNNMKPQISGDHCRCLQHHQHDTVATFFSGSRQVLVAKTCPNQPHAFKEVSIGRAFP